MDEELGGTLVRSYAYSGILITKLDLLSERLLASSLLRPLPPSTDQARREGIEQKLREAQGFFDELCELQREEAECVWPSSEGKSPALDPRRHAKREAILSSARFRTTLDVIATSIKVSLQLATISLPKWRRDQQGTCRLDHH